MATEVLKSFYIFRIEDRLTSKKGSLKNRRHTKKSKARRSLNFGAIPDGEKHPKKQ